MSAQEQAKIERNHARLATLPDKTTQLFSEEFSLVGQQLKEHETYAERIARNNSTTNQPQAQQSQLF